MVHTRVGDASRAAALAVRKRLLALRLLPLGPLPLTAAAVSGRLLLTGGGGCELAVVARSRFGETSLCSRSSLFSVA